MGLSRLTRDSPRKSESGSGSNGRPNGHTDGVNSSELPKRNSTSGDSNAGASPSAGSKRSSRFRFGSLKQLGAATRAEVRASIRNDWDWPLPEVANSDDTAGGTGKREGDDRPDPWTSRVEPDTRFVERTPGSEESEDGSEEEEDLGHAGYLRNGGPEVANGESKNRLLNGGFGGNGTTNGVNGHTRNISSTSAATQKSGSKELTNEAAVAARKERRRKRLREELSWNEGLQIFEARRNAWTGSILKPPEGVEESPKEKSANSSANGTDREAEASKDGFSEAASTLENRQGTMSKTEGEACSRRGDDLIIYTPVPPPIISPEHPIRKEIVPATYSQIYSRVVIQGTTPNLPINLADMTSILVEGWKEDDQWPPKPSGPLEPLVGRRKNRGVGLGMKTNGHGHSRNPSGEKERGLYQNLKKVLRIRTDKEEKPSANAVALLDA